MATRKRASGPEQKLKVGELERVTGTSRSTIRHYEVLGLLPPCEVRGPKLHLYGPEHVARLGEIQRLRERGVPLRDMKPRLSKVRARTPRADPSEERPSTREQIITEAAKRLLAVGYHGLTLETLAKTLRVAKPTIYRHFAGKQALFLAAVKAMRLNLVPQAVRETGERLEAPSQGPLRARMVLENFAAYRGLYTLLQTLTADSDPVVAQAAQRELHSMITNAEPFLRSCVAEGRFRPFDSELLAYVLWGALMGVGEYMLRQPQERSRRIEELVKAYMSFTGRGVLA